MMKRRLIGTDMSRRKIISGGAALLSMAAIDRAMAGGPLASVPTSDAYAAPNFRRLAGAASTPENNGLTVDRNGSVDSTTALNTWIQNLVTNGDRGEAGPAVFKTSGPLVASGGPSLRLSGNGPLATVIKPTASTFPGIHVNLTNGMDPTGWINGIGVSGPSANPVTGQAGFLIDGTKLFQLSNCDVHNEDIAFDWINNCFNSGGYNLSASRFFSCNVALYIRDGDQSGSDMNFYNCNFSPKIFAYCIKGGGGGYGFFGGQCGNGNPTSVDANGVIQIGWDYINGVEADGVGSVLFSRIGLEGWHGCHGVRVYGETNAKFDTCAFNATVATAGQQALDVFKGTDLKNSLITFADCNVGGIYSNAKLGTAAGQFPGNTAPLRQTNWYVPSAGGTANGVTFGNSPTFDILTTP